MKKLFLIAGHHIGDPGAVATHPVLGTVKESDLTIDFRDLLALSLRHFNGFQVVTDLDNMNLADVIKAKNSLIKEGDVLIDIHFNAFANPAANGTEVIVKNGSSPKIKANAAALSLAMANTMKLMNRGVKEESQTGRSRIGILHGAGDRYLLEVCFISNNKDLESYSINKHLLVDALTLEIEKLLK